LIDEAYRPLSFAAAAFSLAVADAADEVASLVAADAMLAGEIFELMALPGICAAPLVRAAPCNACLIRGGPQVVACEMQAADFT